MEHQLYMWGPTRAHIIEQHDTYVDAIKKRVFPQFADINAEAERFLKEKYDALMTAQAGDDVDPADLAETAQAAALRKYESLSFLKHETYLGALAGLYHIWERALRDFIERELNHTVDRADSVRYAWRTNIFDVYTLLKEFGWELTAEPFYEKIEACRLLVNVHKHGKGKSFDDLASKFPHFFRQPFPNTPIQIFGNGRCDLDEIEVSNSDILAMANAIRAFWKRFPERLYCVAK